MSSKREKVKSVIFAGVIGPATIAYGVFFAGRGTMILGILCCLFALLGVALLAHGHLRGRKGSGDLNE